MKTTIKTATAAAAREPVDITLDEANTSTPPSNDDHAGQPVDARPALDPSTPRVLYLDPNTVYEGTGPNRSEASFECDEFEKLAVSILEMRGNIQPIVARPIGTTDELPPGSTYEYVLVSGARRLRACKQHHLQVLAMVSTNFTPLDQSLHRLAENFNRKSLCAIELGWQVQFIREQHSEAKLSDAAIGRLIGADKSAVSKALNLATLPRQMIECFESVEHLRYNDAKPLKDAFTSNPHAVLEAAERIRSGPHLKAPEVLARLAKAGARTADGGAPAGKKSAVERFNTRLDVDGKPIGELSQNKAGNPVITLEIALSDGQREALGRHITSFVRLRVMGLKAPKAAAKAGGSTASTSPAQVAELSS
jgi:ParB family chromosome partitioning protein